MTLQFKIQIRNIQNPPVWRRIVIPDNFTFNDLHLAIQKSFGWSNYHLYQFERSPFDRGWKVKIPDDMYEDEFGVSEVLNSKQTIVSAFIHRMNLKKFVYIYDFGDSWVHDMTLEKTNDEETIRHPICLEGKGTCPPEDCGGSWGYEEMKRYFREEPNDEETNSYREWLGLEENEDYDPDFFNINMVNVLLESLSATPVPIHVVKNNTKKQDTPHFESPYSEIFQFIKEFRDNTKYMSNRELNKYLDEMLSKNKDDEFDDDDDLDYLQGIYDMSEKAKRYIVRIELTDAPGRVTRTLQVPSNMVLSGFAKLIMLAFGRKDLPEPYEFVEEDGYCYASDEGKYALDKEYSNMDDVELNTVGFMLRKKGETVSFNIRKGKKKILWQHTVTLEKCGRYTDNIKHSMELLKGEGFYPSKSMKSMDDYINHLQEGKPDKPNFDTIRKNISDFEADNELPL